MSARILPFVTRDDYERLLFEELNAGATTTNSEQLTSLELMKALYEKSMEALWQMTVYYKKTGKWNETTDNLMRRMVTYSTRICGELSGVRQYGEAAEATQSEAGGDSHGAIGATGSGD
jgi:hypothetical protein